MSAGALDAQVRAGLELARSRATAMGLPTPQLQGSLLRPTISLAFRPESGDDPCFWMGALAVQMVHEASLLHDDILDGAELRRGQPTRVSTHGIGSALVQGDHLLTASYAVAAAAESPSFLLDFIGAVERTVAGEIAQGRSAGRIVSRGDYRRMVAGKSGELFGIAAALGHHRAGREASEARKVGVRVGSLYQMVDDYLDLCPGAPSGKVAFQDYRQRKWTWVMDQAGLPGFGLSEDELRDRLFRPSADGRSPMARALLILEDEAELLGRAIEPHADRPDRVAELIRSWITLCHGVLAVAEESYAPASRSRTSTPSPRLSQRRVLGQLPPALAS